MMKTPVQVDIRDVIRLESAVGVPGGGRIVNAKAGYLFDADGNVVAEFYSPTDALQAKNALNNVFRVTLEKVADVLASDHPLKLQHAYRAAMAALGREIE